MAKTAGQRSQSASARSRGAPHVGQRVQRSAARLASTTWGDRAARVGLAARGIVYLLLAYLVARIALGALGHGSTSRPASGPGVADALAGQTGGRAVLGVLAIGLLLYALFSLLDAILHHDDESPTAKRWGDRALSAFGVVLYGAFGIYALHAALSGQAKTSAQDTSQKTQLTADVLRWPGGWLYLGLFGGVVVVIAAFLISRAARRSFRPRLDRDAMSPRMWWLAMVLGTVGYLGRAGLFAVVGWSVLSAAVENDPAKGQGVDGAVRQLAHNTAGAALLWCLVVGLAAYGGYMAVETRYRRV